MSEEVKIQVQQIQPRSNVLLTDFMTGMDEVTTRTFLISHEHEGPVNKLTSRFKCWHLSVWVALFITAAFTSSVAFTVDALSLLISKGRKELVVLVVNYYLGWFVWVLSAVVFA